MPNAPFLAMITPLGGGDPPRPDNTLPQPPLGIWGGRPPNYVDIGGPGPQPTPTPPIYYPPPGQLPGTPPPGYPTHPIYNPPYPDQGLPGQPPGIWGGRPPWVDNTLPGPQPTPTPPIYLPPEPPLGTWGGRPPEWVDNTLPELPPSTGGDNQRPIEWKAGWSPATGWVVVGIPTGPTVTPSK